jgi:hypothetical protein
LWPPGKKVRDDLDGAGEGVDLDVGLFSHFCYS